MTKRLLIFLAFSLNLFFIVNTNGQSFRIEEFKNLFGKGNPLKLNGGFSANSVYTAGNESSGREPFAYFLSGNVNLNIYGQFNLPFSFNLTNSGTSYKLPSTPNRLSIHPSYKWITAHIGDVSMSFSPYTLNGHMFTGVGVEVMPDGWEFSAMYGRLLKAVEYDLTHSALLPTFKRMGYGTKMSKIAQSYQVSINLFGAKDQTSSLISLPDSLGVTPMQNLAGSVSFLYRPVKFLEFGAEYGLSMLTSDTRSANDSEQGILGLWGATNMSSSYYKAIKAQINYVGETNRFGVAYERVDPNYRTLGAFFFVNNIENITFNAAQALWENKMNIDFSIGYEHDDLAKNMASATSRVVGSINVAAMISERVNTSISYTNFQTYTNVRSNFELINQENQFDNLDTLNFVQLSQSANINLNVITRKNEAELHNLNINLSYQDAANKQGGIYHPGSVTEMMNAVSSYTWTFLKSGLSLNGALNINNSKIMNGNTLTWGPTVGASSRLLKKKVILGSSISYNSGRLDGIKQNEIFIARINSSYSPVQRHNITLAYNYQWRSLLNKPSGNNSLLTVGYACSF